MVLSLTRKGDCCPSKPRHNARAVTINLARRCRVMFFCVGRENCLVELLTWARMMRSMLADQPYLEVTTTQGVLLRRVLIFTFSTSGSARAPFHQLTTPLNCSCTNKQPTSLSSYVVRQQRCRQVGYCGARLSMPAGHQLQADHWHTIALGKELK